MYGKGMMTCPWCEIILLPGSFHTKTGFCLESNIYQNPSESSKSKASAMLESWFNATAFSTTLPMGKKY